MYKITTSDERGSTVVKALAFYAASPNFIPGTTYSPLSRFRSDQ